MLAQIQQNLSTCITDANIFKPAENEVYFSGTLVFRIHLQIKYFLKIWKRINLLCCFWMVTLTRVVEKIITIFHFYVIFMLLWTSVTWKWPTIRRITPIPLLATYIHPVNCIMSDVSQKWYHLKRTQDINSPKKMPINRVWYVSSW